MVEHFSRLQHPTTKTKKAQALRWKEGRTVWSSNNKKLSLTACCCSQLIDSSALQNTCCSGKIYDTSKKWTEGMGSVGRQERWVWRACDAFNLEIAITVYSFPTLTPTLIHLQQLAVTGGTSDQKKCEFRVYPHPPFSVSVHPKQYVPPCGFL